MRDDADPALMAQWARGWTLTRNAPPPEPVAEGWKIEANRPDHRWRFLYPRLCDAAMVRAHERLDGGFTLKIAADPARVRAALPPEWMIEAPAYVMTCEPRAAIRHDRVPDGYPRTFETTAPGATLLTITSDKGEMAASGRLALIDDLAVFDRIRTEDAYQRRGLGSAVMTTLGRLADEAGAARWALAATVAGHALYETLGWQVHAPYTTASLIPRS